MEQKAVNLLGIGPGARLSLADGSLVEVVENPGDGTWVFCRYLSGGEAALPDAGEEHPIFASDVVAVVPDEGGHG